MKYRKTSSKLGRDVISESQLYVWKPSEKWKWMCTFGLPAVQMGLVQLGVIQMCTFTFTFLKASKVIIDFQYFTNNILSQFWWRFPILHKPFFLFGTESTMWLRKLKGWLVGVWDGTNLGWIPTGNLLSQFHPKIPMIRRCSTILPWNKYNHHNYYNERRHNQILL